MSDLVSIIILNWNGITLTEQCLKSILENTGKVNYEIILVDNGSNTENVSRLNELKKQGFIDKLVLNKENKGFAYANNQGFNVAKGNFFFMLNNDTFVTKAWLGNALELLKSNEKIGAVGSTLVEKNETEKKREGHVKEKQTLCGAAMLMKKKVIEEIGLLDAENFSPIYGEETDWCYRARHAGYKLLETEKSRIIHLGSQDTKRQTGSAWQYELMNTHRLKAMFFNLSIMEFSKHIAGLLLIFFKSFKEKRVRLLLKSYWNNLKNIKLILRERRKRKAKLLF